MSTTLNTHTGERLSFFKLFCDKKYRIVIPIVQRDYAQGRESKKEVRERFLDALYKYLEDNKPNRDLDFIYGSLSEGDNLTDFIPLDGQQRLTTLFLLHWYLYQISVNKEKKEMFKAELFKDGKSMFTYETRSSSSEFCNDLMSNDIDFDNLLKSDKELSGNCKGNSLSKTIKNCSWFYLSWQYDPTIQSMLIMLDAIHIRFANKKEFFDRLLEREKPIITFLFLDLEVLKLTDDLYIKMNSRGIPLTPFENFKAKFGQYLETIKTDRSFYLSHIGPNKEVSIKDYFSFNIDTKWADLLWNYRKFDAEKGVNFDDKIMNFIRVIFTNQYAMNVNVSLNEKDDTLEYLLGTDVAKKSNKDYTDIISYHKFKELNVLFDQEEDEKYTNSAKKITNEDEIEEITRLHKELKILSYDCTIYLLDSFDCLTNGNKEIEIYLADNYKFYFDENNVFKNALKHDFKNNQERLCFHAYLRYLIVNKNDNDRSGINQWMRVIHNLSHPDNTIIDKATEVAAAVKSIEELLPYSKNILEQLKTKTKIKFFRTEQVLEEKIKAHLITKNDDWKNKIEEVEKHGYFNGQIGFILEFAGILAYYETNKNCDWSIKENSEYFRQFSAYADKASKVFEESYKYRKNNKDYVFERAVLTKGNYLTDTTHHRKNLLSTNVVKNNIERDHSWKRLLRISAEKPWKDRRSLVKDVFDDKRFDKDDLINSLKSICKDTINSWRDYFIDCPCLIDYCKQGFIRLESENEILLYGQSKSNHYHAEMYSYYLWKKFIDPQKNNLESFKNVYYKDVKSIDDKAGIFLNDCYHNSTKYEAFIYYSNNDNMLYSYKISFKKSEGVNLPEQYGDDVKDILNECNFNWNDEYTSYFYTCDNINDVDKKLKQLVEKLKVIL